MFNSTMSKSHRLLNCNFTWGQGLGHLGTVTIDLKHISGIDIGKILSENISDSGMSVALFAMATFGDMINYNQSYIRINARRQLLPSGGSLSPRYV
jgi:hypothetical protein